MKNSSLLSPFSAMGADACFLSRPLRSAAMGACVALALVSAASADPASSPAPGKSPIVITGWVETGKAKVAGVEVRLVAPDGSEIGRADKVTRDSGTFRIEVKSLPSSFRAEATGGALGSEVFIAEADDFDARLDSLHINPATTVVGLMLMDSPKETEAQIESLFNRYFGIFGDSSLSKRPLNGEFESSLNSELGNGRGTASAFVARLEGLLGLPSPSETRSTAAFDATAAQEPVAARSTGTTSSAPPPTVGATPGNPTPTTAASTSQVPKLAAASTSAPPPVFAASTGTTASAVGDDTFNGTTSELVKAGTSELFKGITGAGDWMAGPAGALVAPAFGWLLESLGMGAGPSETDIKLQELSGKMDNLSLQLKMISGRLETLAAQGDARGTDALKILFNGRISSLEPAMRDLRAYAAKSYSLAERINYGMESASDLKTDRQALIVLGTTIETDFAAKSFSVTLTTSSGTGDSALSYYSQLVASNYRFWTQASYRQVREKFDYFDMLQLVQYEVVCELGHYKGKVETTPQGKYWFNQQKNTLDSARAAELAAVKQPPPDFEVIDTVQKLVWYGGGAVGMGKPNPNLALTFIAAKIGGVNDKNTFKDPRVEFNIGWGPVNPAPGFRLTPVEPVAVDYKNWDYPNNLSAWRLPTRDELESLRLAYQGKAPTDDRGIRISFVTWLRQQSGTMQWRRQAMLLRENVPSGTADNIANNQASFETYAARIKDRVEKTYEVNSVYLKNKKNQVAGLEVGYWNKNTLWWTSSYSVSEPVWRISRADNKNDNDVSVWAGGVFNNKPLKEKLERQISKIHIYRLDVGDFASLWWDNVIAKVRPTGYLMYDQFLDMRPGYDRGSSYNNEPPEGQNVFPENFDTNWGNNADFKNSTRGRISGTNGSYYVWHGNDDRGELFGAFVMPVRNLTENEALKYYYLPNAPTNGGSPTL